VSQQTHPAAKAPAGMLLHHGTDLFGAASILRDDRMEAASIDALLAHPMLNATASQTKRRTAARQQPIHAEAA
jgi:hypothetical protein